MRIQSLPLSTVTPSLPSSVAIAAIRSVSLTRQLPMPVSVVGASANNAVIASVIAASGIATQSMLPPRNRVPVRASIQSGPKRMSAPRRSSTSANATSPWIDSRPTPVTRTGPPPIAPAARK